jgi:hypothetical protein
MIVLDEIDGKQALEFLDAARHFGRTTLCAFYHKHIPSHFFSPAKVKKREE